MRQVSSFPLAGRVLLVYQCRHRWKEASYGRRNDEARRDGMDNRRCRERMTLIENFAIAAPDILSLVYCRA